MTTPETNIDDLDPNAPDYVNRLRQGARQAATASAAAAAAEARATEEANKALSAQRDLALYRAGVDVDSPMGKMFARSYEGEITEDAIKAEWLAISGGTQQEGIPADQQQAMARISGAVGGATPSAAVVDFDGTLEQIPMMANGTWNHDYVNQVLAATQQQAVREGKAFETTGGQMKWANGGGQATPAIVPTATTPS